MLLRGETLFEANVKFWDGKEDRECRELLDDGVEVVEGERCININHLHKCECNKDGGS